MSEGSAKPYLSLHPMVDGRDNKELDFWGWRRSAPSRANTAQAASKVGISAAGPGNPQAGVLIRGLCRPFIEAPSLMYPPRVPSSHFRAQTFARKVVPRRGRFLYAFSDKGARGHTKAMGPAVADGILCRTEVRLMRSIEHP